MKNLLSTKSINLLLVVLVSLLIGCQSKVTDADFKGTFTGETTEMKVLEKDTSDNPLKSTAVMKGEGEVDLFGKVNLYLTENIDHVKGIATAKITLVDSKGDSLFLDGKANMSNLDSLGNGTFTANETITGGSGKFAEATGSSTTKGEIKGDGSGSWTTEGRISY